MVPIYYMHGRDDDDIINDPERHIIYKGAKFMTLKEMYDYKMEMRLIKSDKKGLAEDIECMRAFFSEKGMASADRISQYAKYTPLP